VCVTQFYYKIIAMDTFLLFQLHFTTREYKKIPMFPMCVRNMGI